MVKDKGDILENQAALNALIARAVHLGSEQGKNGQRAAPVENWQPDHCGEIDIRIARDGQWYHQGTPILRPALWRLFASILRRDADGQTYLVTPVEKMRITVDDAPFLAVDLHHDRTGAQPSLWVRTNVDDIVHVGPDNRLRFEIDEATQGLKPYVNVRGRLEALFTRNLALELTEFLESRVIDGQEFLGVSSQGVFFPAMPVTALD